MKYIILALMVLALFIPTPVQAAKKVDIIFLNAPYQSTKVYDQSNCNAAAFIYNAQDPRTNPNWKQGVINSAILYKSEYRKHNIYLSFNGVMSNETPAEMDYNTMFLLPDLTRRGILIKGIYLDASSTGGKTKDQLKQWLLTYNKIAKGNGITFGFYLGDAYHESKVGWTKSDLQVFASAGVRIWIDVYSGRMDELRGNGFITWDYPYLSIHFHLGNSGETIYYKTYEELHDQFELVLKHHTVESVQVYPCRIPEWWIQYPEWAARAIGEVTQPPTPTIHPWWFFK